MDWIKSFQKAVDYVEEHICEPVDYKRIAQEMNVSSFYFQKIFPYYAVLQSENISAAAGLLLPEANCFRRTKKLSTLL